MLFDSIFDIQNIIKKIGYDQFMEYLRAKDITIQFEAGDKASDIFKKQSPVIIEALIRIIVSNLGNVKEEIYILIEKETNFSREDLQKMQLIEVVDLIKTIFSDGIPPMFFSGLKKTE